MKDNITQEDKRLVTLPYKEYQELLEANGKEWGRTYDLEKQLIELIEDNKDLNKGLETQVRFRKSHEKFIDTLQQELIASGQSWLTKLINKIKGK